MFITHLAVMGQMTVILLSPTIRRTPFRDVYRRLTGRGMCPANALGHVVGKLALVLYGMLKNVTPYDEAKYRQELGLAQLDHASGSGTVDLSPEVIDVADGPDELISDNSVDT